MQKKADKISEDLLSENSESKGIWDSIARCVLLSGIQLQYSLVVLSGPSLLLGLVPLTETAVSTLIAKFPDMPSVFKHCVALSGDLIPPHIPDFSILL